jgi:transcriptional regulator CtsR
MIVKKKTKTKESTKTHKLQMASGKNGGGVIAVVKVQPLQNPNLFSHTLNELIQTVRKQR